MLSCIRATELVEKKLDYKLNFLEKSQLYLHTRMCSACSLYEQQSKILDKALKKHVDGVSDQVSPELPLSIEIKERIIRNIQK